MRVVPRPANDEFAPVAAGYVAQVRDGVDALQELRRQREAVGAILARVSEADAAFRYAPGKWSIKGVVGHLSDVERVFSYRLLRIARGDEAPLAGFDEGDYAATAAFDSRSLADLIADWMAVRSATIALAEGLPSEAWNRRGIANGSPVSARALLYIILGHVSHHCQGLAQRYGLTSGL